MITDDLENKDKAEKIHQLLLEIDEQQLQAKYRFKHRTLPFLIIIAIPVSYTHLDVYKRQLQQRMLLFLGLKQLQPKLFRWGLWYEPRCV